MFDILYFLGSSFQINKVNIDNFVFKLHYKATFVFLVASSMLVISRQLFGENINCIADYEYKSIIDAFCWINSTFSMKGKFKGKIGEDFVYPGVTGEHESEGFQYHKYYQWVSLVLSAQALCFYLPRYIWKSFESGRISALSRHLKEPMLDEELIPTQQSQITNLVAYLSANMRHHNLFFYQFIFCEILNFVNVILQLSFLDFFLHHQFSTFGADVWEFYNSKDPHAVDPSDRVFPKVTKCIFYKYGPSATVERIDSICVLPLNELNAKLFLLLWIWFIFIAFITGLLLFYRLMICIQPTLRYVLFRSKFQIVPVEQVDFIFKRCDIGDWWLIYQLTKNIDTITFKNIMKDLRNALKSFECKNGKIENVGSEDGNKED